MTVALQGSPQLVTRNAVLINLEGPILMQGKLKKKEGMMKVKWVDVFVEVREVCVATFSAGSNPGGCSVQNASRRELGAIALPKAAKICFDIRFGA